MMKRYPSLRNNVFHLSIRPYLASAWQRGQSRADWPELREWRLDRKGRERERERERERKRERETFFPDLVSQSEIRTSFFLRDYPLPTVQSR